MGHDIVACRNNEEMYDKKLVEQYLSALQIFNMHCMR